jgi:hypothetical protein
MEFKRVFRAFKARLNPAYLMHCARGRTRQRDAVIDSWTSNYVEHIHFQLINQLICLVLENLKLMFGEMNSSHWQLRDCWQSSQQLILATPGNEMERQEVRKHLED